MKLVTLPEKSYEKLANTKNKYNLYFDDCYQLNIALEYKLTLVTLDHDFDKVIDTINVTFL